MKEIGGYFQLEKLIDNEYYKNMERLNSGRNSLIYILKSKKIKKVYLPYYLCDSVSNKVIQEGYDVDYYNVDKEFNPIFNKNLGEDEYLYIVNFYGQINNEKLLEYNQKYKRIIVDNTHAFYQNPILDIDTIYSCRKFFGVPDGAYLYTNTKLNESLTIDDSKDRIKHLVGRLGGTASTFYKDFQKSDEEFETESLKKMSIFTQNILGAIDYNKVKESRNMNYNVLYESLKEINKLNLNLVDGAFSYPLLVENGEEIRKKLIENKIYISMLWPNVPKSVSEDSIEYIYSKNIIPIPCDQRYNSDDMNYIIDIVKGFIKK
ncbi:hypothetical protein [Paraclostridium bifermentans]|uniref:hypothetical protein n=1 Tax=Paraclostridium bifermentans TaxID=1490 RepID=UPI00290AD47E|nr:hypothetical protein [Paraclostridium bifermentans]MDU3335661.1 hypothetical protein [Paraclostridium bifermentans]